MHLVFRENGKRALNATFDATLHFKLYWIGSTVQVRTSTPLPPRQHLFYACYVRLDPDLFDPFRWSSVILA
jgi:hypothetical protein